MKLTCASPFFRLLLTCALASLPPAAMAVCVTPPAPVTVTDLITTNGTLVRTQVGVDGADGTPSPNDPGCAGGSAPGFIGGYQSDGAGSVFEVFATAAGGTGGMGGDGLAGVDGLPALPFADGNPGSPGAVGGAAGDGGFVSLGAQAGADAALAAHAESSLVDLLVDSGPGGRGGNGGGGGNGSAGSDDPSVGRNGGAGGDSGSGGAGGRGSDATVRGLAVTGLDKDDVADPPFSIPAVAQATVTGGRGGDGGASAAAGRGGDGGDGVTGGDGGHGGFGGSGGDGAAGGDVITADGGILANGLGGDTPDTGLENPASATFIGMGGQGGHGGTGGAGGAGGDGGDGAIVGTGPLSGAGGAGGAGGTGGRGGDGGSLYSAVSSGLPPPFTGSPDLFGLTSAGAASSGERSSAAVLVQGIGGAGGVGGDGGSGGAGGLAGNGGIAAAPGAGGNGGRGGDGGSAVMGAAAFALPIAAQPIAAATVDVSAYGGSGGSGGNAGDPGLAFRGDGGNGGYAEARGLANTNAFAGAGVAQGAAFAAGGDGGAGTLGGNGGAALAALGGDAGGGFGSTSHGILDFLLQARGGDGGTGGGGGGDGGRADGLLTATTSDPGGVRAELIRTDMAALGGSGGSTNEGSAGRGGDARLDIVDAANLTTGTGNLFFDAPSAAGGNGGNSSQVGGHGGNAGLGTGFRGLQVARQITIADALMRGGRGGNGTDVGGNGGNADLTATLRAQDLSVTARVIGGSGGDAAPFAGFGGFGGNADVDLALLAVDGTADSQITAIGGSGGVGTAGDGGDARVRLASDITATRAALEASARGGDSGRIGHGGDAIVEVFAGSKGQSNAKATALGGVSAAEPANRAMRGDADAHATAVGRPANSVVATAIAQNERDTSPLRGIAGLPAGRRFMPAGQLDAITTHGEAKQGGQTFGYSFSEDAITPQTQVVPKQMAGRLVLQSIANGSDSAVDSRSVLVDGLPATLPVGGLIGPGKGAAAVTEYLPDDARAAAWFPFVDTDPGEVLDHAAVDVLMLGEFASNHTAASNQTANSFTWDLVLDLDTRHQVFVGLAGFGAGGDTLGLLDLLIAVEPAVGPGEILLSNRYIGLGALAGLDDFLLSDVGYIGLVDVHIEMSFNHVAATPWFDGAVLAGIVSQEFVPVPATWLLLVPGAWLMHRHHRRRQRRHPDQPGSDPAGQSP